MARSIRRHSRFFSLFLLLLLLVACAGDEQEQQAAATPTSLSLFADGERSAADATGASANGGETGGAALAGTSSAPGAQADDSRFTVRVDATSPQGAISPLIYGLSGATPEVMAELRPTVNSWGGNPSTRYNWKLGDAWNTGSDSSYRNTDYGYDMAATGLPADAYEAKIAREAGAEMRLALPTLGWVARNTDPETCSFPLPDGSCGNAFGANCKSPGEIADPTVTSVRSTPADIQEWLGRLIGEAGYHPRFIAMDNEPELWGYTHYDVHPECTTYQEILEKYLTYATAVQAVAPDAELTGPATCCWEFYWHSAAGSRDEAKHDDRPFLPWFLDQVRMHDEEYGARTLDVLDIHYYPEGVFNDEIDPETAAQRLRSTRSLWDGSYRDESWIREAVRLIPRMQEEIADHYPGTKLGISEWNWGAETTMNGALAIADVLGIMGREEVYFAAYWRYPPLQSPGAYAFKLYTNYDGEGSRFEGTVLPVRRTTAESVGAYAARDEESGNIRVMLVNRQPQQAEPVRVLFDGFAPAGPVTAYRYDEGSTGIATVEATVDGDAVLVDLPPYSITLLVIGGSAK